MYDNGINVTASYRKDGTLWFPYFVMRPKENRAEGITENQRRLNVKQVMNLIKIILCWTSRLDQLDWSREVGVKRPKRYLYAYCEYTPDKDRLDDADKLLLYSQE
ncbi:hypothetical protein LSH36_312g03050 [Paralvinella palmiformis]|uniref:Uncharacterized protein n=1 Tax=Paralvinella palmiformis TaxID=53620 RepID=A0AAD9JHY0_9ANNE|nr:hypothetical protein LSH36_312g03050 [Paralvinella palmiformis]